MTGQLTIFNGSERDNKPEEETPQRPPGQAAPLTATAQPPRSEQPDDGSLHYMMTGQPEPKTARCRTCSAAILWARTERGKKMPLDAAPVCDAVAQTRALFVLRETDRSMPLALAAWGLEGTEPHYRCHFDTCAGEQAAA